MHIHTYTHTDTQTETHTHTHTHTQFFYRTLKLPVAEELEGGDSFGLG